MLEWNKAGFTHLIYLVAGCLDKAAMVVYVPEARLSPAWQ